jgi:3-dehydroquinate dehydratase-2
MKVLIIHGPNLNLLGKREKNFYGRKTLAEINNLLMKKADSYRAELKIFQSNSESEIISLIHQHSKWADVLIINPAGYTHTSVVIRDAILAVELPTIEVHLSNIYQREQFRRKSLLADIVVGQITGFGFYSYLLALEAAVEYLKKKTK